MTKQLNNIIERIDLCNDSALMAILDDDDMSATYDSNDDLTVFESNDGDYIVIAW